MSRKKGKTYIVCDRCGEIAPIDKEKSNNNWTVYKTNIKCECGGVYSTVVTDGFEDKNNKE